MTPAELLTSAADVPMASESDAPKCMPKMDAIAWAVGWNGCREAMLATSRAAGKGWAMVPMEPTQEQIQAAIERPHTKSEDMYHSIYRAMVGAAKLDDEK